MNIAFVVYDGMTTLDFIGIYDPITRLQTMGFMPELRWDICSRTIHVVDNTGMQFGATCVGKSLSDYDMIVVPGGFGSRKLISDEQFIAWIKTAGTRSTKVSVCTGALILGAAGFLKGKKATTHPSAWNMLINYCQAVSTERVVEDGDVITARGVTAAVDLGLYICEKLVGQEVKERIRLQMDYQTAK